MSNLYKNIVNLRKIAIKNNLKDDIDSYIEKCYRHYSKTYFTELEKAYELPIERVVLIYMEDEMADMSKEELKDLLDKDFNDIELPVVAMNYEPPRDLTDDEWIAQQNLLLKKQQEDEAKQAEIVKKTHESIEKFGKAVDEVFDKEESVDFGIKE